MNHVEGRRHPCSRSTTAGRGRRRARQRAVRRDQRPSIFITKMLTFRATCSSRQPPALPRPRRGAPSTSCCCAATCRCTAIPAVHRRPKAAGSSLGRDFNFWLSEPRACCSRRRDKVLAACLAMALLLLALFALPVRRGPRIDGAWLRFGPPGRRDEPHTVVAQPSTAAARTSCSRVCATGPEPARGGDRQARAAYNIPRPSSSPSYPARRHPRRRRARPGLPPARALPSPARPPRRGAQATSRGAISTPCTGRGRAVRTLGAALPDPEPSDASPSPTLTPIASSASTRSPGRSATSRARVHRKPTITEALLVALMARGTS